MLPLISVIVPVYNVEKFLDRCIDSILNQTYTNLEVILVDDGSTDRSLEICKNYQACDGRIKVIHKTNGGVSSARNVGLLSTNGKYISFVDSDDYLEPNCLSILYEALINNNCDIACSNIICESVNGKELNILKYNESNVIFDVNHYDMYNRSVYNKLFSSNCLKTQYGPLLFDESLYYGEDALFTISAFSNAKNIIRLSNPLYHYVIHENSAMQKFSIKSLTEIDAWSKIVNILKPFPEAQNEARAQYSLNSQRILINIFRHQSKDIKLQKKVLKKVKKYRNEVLNSNYIPLNNKISYFIFTVCPRTYTHLLDISKIILKR
ncbi:glycosyltransferase family 2 protein [Cytobacillus gottheilii]|uniref:glycosyltransferase family 2 protein n=1 Tax=Cytobacillus gottheilii TaxID=859144 RepID=UPI0009BB1D2A|nr:glycosyltransferase [Cytobacillus gottheilii]